MTTPELPEAGKSVADKAAEAVTGKPLDKPVSETVSDAAAEAKDTVQEGFSRFDATARKVTAEAASHASEMADDAAESAKAYSHQGLDSLNRAGTAVAGAITQRPFVALISALLGGAMVALARR